MAVFDLWLKDKLIALDSDDSVYSDYIKGILNGDESEEEKEETLLGVISGITDIDIDNLCKEILHKWKVYEYSTQQQENDSAEPKVDIETQLSRLMEHQNKVATVAPKPAVSTTDQKLKQSILMQYSEISDQETDDEEGGHDEGAGATSNREEVQKAEQERREKLKREAMLKREKDKLDRDKQKEQQTERKDKEKKRTQKGEKRR